MKNYKLKIESEPFGLEFERIGASSFLIFHLSFIIYNYSRLFERLWGYRD
jgi:hypothetical protein